MRYIHADISPFLYKRNIKVCKGGGKLVNIICTKSKCLNNKKGQCTASEIYYDGLCQTYITHNHASKSNVGICQRRKGALTSDKRNILK